MNLLRIGSTDAPLSSVLVPTPKIHLEANDIASYSGQGQSWNDIGETKQFTGSILNGAQFLSSNGGWFAFDGTDEHIVLQSTSSNWSLKASPITIQVWFYLNSLTNSYGSACGIFGKQSAGFSFDGYSLAVGVSGQLRITTNGTIHSRTSNSADEIVAVGNWYFASVIMSMSNESNTIRGYIGDTQIISGIHGTDTSIETNSIILARGFQRNANPETYLNGRIGAFYAYDRELTQNEISQNFNATRRRYGV